MFTFPESFYFHFYISVQYVPAIALQYLIFNKEKLERANARDKKEEEKDTDRKSEIHQSKPTSLNAEEGNEMIK